ncbi:hypothetical protein D9M71_452250 [compost metagenome]
MQKARFDDAVYCLAQGYIAQEPGRVLAAQFQGGAGQVGGHGALADGKAGGHGACERDLVGARVFDQRLAGHAATGHHIQRPCGQAGVNGQLGNAQDGQRGEFAGLDDDAATGDQCRAELPQGDHGREVPGHDADYHADRLAQGEGGVALAAERGQRRGEGLAAELGRPAGVVTQKVRGLIDLEIARDIDQLARLASLQLRQLFPVLFDEIGEFQQHAGTHGGGGL